MRIVTQGPAQIADDHGKAVRTDDPAVPDPGDEFLFCDNLTGQSAQGLQDPGGSILDPYVLAVTALQGISVDHKSPVANLVGLRFAHCSVRR